MFTRHVKFASGFEALVQVVKHLIRYGGCNMHVKRHNELIMSFQRSTDMVLLFAAHYFHHCSGGGHQLHWLYLHKVYGVDTRSYIVITRTRHHSRLLLQHSSKVQPNPKTYMNSAVHEFTLCSGGGDHVHRQCLQMVYGVDTRCPVVNKLTRLYNSLW